MEGGQTCPSMSNFIERRSNAQPVSSVLLNPSVQGDIEGRRHLGSGFDDVHHTILSTDVGGPRLGHSLPTSRNGRSDVPHQFQQQSRRPYYAQGFPVTPEPISEDPEHSPILGRQALQGSAASSDACPLCLNRDLQSSFDDCPRWARSPSFQYPSPAFSRRMPNIFGVNITQRFVPCCEPVVLPAQPVHANLPGTHKVLSWTGHPMEIYNPPLTPVPVWHAFRALNPVDLERRQMDSSGFSPSASTQATNPPISQSYYPANAASAGATPPGADHVPATPAEQSAHNDRMFSKQCGWKDSDGSICNTAISYDCQDHFANAHGIIQLSRHSTVSCRWCEPKKRMKRGCILRHVREVHLRVSRSHA